MEFRSHLGVESCGNDRWIEHGSAHGRFDGKVLGRAGLCCDNDTVTLCYGDKQLADGDRLSVDTINLHHGHVMLIELKIHWSKGSHVDDVEEVLLAWYHRILSILRLIDEDGIRNWFGPLIVVRVIHRLVIIYQTRSLSMIEVADSQSGFLIDAIWCIVVLENKRPSKPVNVLSADVSMVPVSAGLRHLEFIDEGRSGLDWTLGNHRRTVRIGRIPLKDSVEMNGSALIHKVVSHGNLDHVAEVCCEGRAWPLTVDTDERS